VGASGSPAPAYQWFQNNSLLSGATNATLTFSPLDPTNAGPYYVIVQNTTNSVVNSVQSSTVSVRVLADNPITNVISPTLSQVALPPIGTDAATGIDPAGTYLCVLDFGTMAFSGQVNGITFTPVSLQTTQSGTDPYYGGTWTASTTDANGFKSVAGGGLGGQADGSMASVLTGASYLGVAPTNTTATLNFGGLTLGAQYALRYYYKQWVGDSPTRPVQFTFNGDGTNAVFQTDEDVGWAYYIEYDFTAAGGTVSLLLTDESVVVNEGPMIYAITLQQTAAAPALVAPVINTQPVGFTNWIGLSGSLSVSASGNPAPTYQWYQNNSLLPGATSALLSLSPLVATNAGSYYVIVQNTTNSVVNSVQSSTVSVGVISNVVFSPTLSQVQLPSSDTDDATGIGTGANTNYLCVLDFGLAAFSATINGITFTPVNLPAVTSTNGTDPNYGGTWTATTTDTNGFRDVAGGGASLTGQADGQMALVLAGASYVSIAPVATTITFDFGVLTPGAQYSLCYYFRQYVAEDSPTRPVQFTFNGDTTTNGTCTVDEDIGGAYCIAYAFTAANSTVSLLLTDESAVANEGPMIYAITLQQTAAAPQSVVLNYSLSGTSLTLSWDPSITGYVLESATQLPTTPTSWTPVSGVVSNSVTVDASTGKQFYRLLKQ
jgi:hypothetical protein